MTDLTAERARELLKYDAQTGSLKWLQTRGKARVGAVAGSDFSCSPNRTSYRRIRIDGRLYYAHRVVWLIVYGRWPVGQIDHISGDGTDNRLSNLREATVHDNARNQPRQRNNKSGTPGVYWCRIRKQWHARITADGKIIHLGRFSTKQQAVEARRAAEIKYEFHPNHGREPNQ